MIFYKSEEISKNFNNTFIVHESGNKKTMINI